MAGRVVDLGVWNRADQFRFFRGFQRPHYAITSRVDVTRLKAGRRAGLSPFRACVWAIGCGVHAVPELRMRFRGEVVTEYDRVELSMAVPLPDGNFNYAYVPWEPSFEGFDRVCRERIEAVRAGLPLAANDGSRDDLAYLSCLPWLDYTALDNALPHAEDCIPRVSWGRFVEAEGRWSCAMTIQVHHALVDGRQVGDFFEAVRDALKMA
ncbi:chloramphenicol acetyltransferase [Rubellimicrobium mesophilum DSM 19309]|uniref:Chloramphenicol acetyltransferase n=1 Tax=Rubellimicrobium mesophilum DSM 19309 TaxID=442562 RepID=A0A017HB25_9RHOB|nr:CatA-like O-acetyltransferase [Rubellimicrobium mesophilum]EYD71546.1 chloramphenicol acetyltransferase [Rubellimicrobium mesophilum DSM 19309]